MTDDATIITEAVADIRRALVPPLRRGSGDLRPFIAGAINLARVVAAIPATKAADDRDRKRKFKKALDALGDDCPESARQILQTYGAQRVSGRLDPLGEFLAFQSAEIVSYFSTKQPVARPDGNVHKISKIIFGAATGREASGTLFIKAVRREIDRRKHTASAS